MRPTLAAGYIARCVSCCICDGGGHGRGRLSHTYAHPPPPQRTPHSSRPLPPNTDIHTHTPVPLQLSMQTVTSRVLHFHVAYSIRSIRMCHSLSNRLTLAGRVACSSLSAPPPIPHQPRPYLPLSCMLFNAHLHHTTPHTLSTSHTRTHLELICVVVDCHQPIQVDRHRHVHRNRWWLLSAACDNRDRADRQGSSGGWADRHDLAWARREQQLEGWRMRREQRRAAPRNGISCCAAASGGSTARAIYKLSVATTSAAQQLRRCGRSAIQLARHAPDSERTDRFDVSQSRIPRRLARCLMPPVS